MKKTTKAPAVLSQELSEELRALWDEIALMERHADGGVTTAEIAKHTGRSAGRVRSMLRQIGEKHKLLVGRRGIESIDGRMFWSPTYRVAGQHVDTDG